MGPTQQNPKKLWFRAKRYGWGWYPVTWQGWLAILAYVGFIVRLFLTVDAQSHSGSDTLYGMLVPVVGATFMLILLCYLKGEKPGWRWGKDK